MKRTFTAYPSSYIKASQPIFAFGGYYSIAPHRGETEEEYRERQLKIREKNHELREAAKERKSSFFRRYKPQPFVVTPEIEAEIDALVEEYRDELNLPKPEYQSTRMRKANNVDLLDNCPYCGGTILDNGRCAYCGSKVYSF